MLYSKHTFINFKSKFHACFYKIIVFIGRSAKTVIVCVHQKIGSSPNRDYIEDFVLNPLTDVIFFSDGGHLIRNLPNVRGNVCIVCPSRMKKTFLMDFGKDSPDKGQDEEAVTLPDGV